MLLRQADASVTKEFAPPLPSNPIPQSYYNSCGVSRRSSVPTLYTRSSCAARNVESYIESRNDKYLYKESSNTFNASKALQIIVLDGKVIRKQTK